MVVRLHYRYILLILFNHSQLISGQRFHFEQPTLGSCSTYNADRTYQQESLNVFCYIGTWYTAIHFGSFTGTTVDSFLCTHIIIGYYEINRRSWDLSPPTTTLDVELVKRVQALKNDNPNLRLLIMIGGYNDNRDDPEKYVQLTKLDDNTHTFANNIAKFLSKNRLFDGVDFQWNYPGRHRISNPDEDRELLGKFTEKLCKRLRKDRFTCMITVQRPLYNIVDMTKTLQAFSSIVHNADYVHVWTADIPPEPTAFKEMYHADLLFKPPAGTYLYANNSKYTVEAMINFFTDDVLKNDVKKRKKLILTIPMQANSYQLANYKWRDKWPNIANQDDLHSIPKPPDLGEETLSGYETGLEQYPFYEICYRAHLLPLNDPEKLFLYSHYSQNGTDNTPVAFSKKFFVPTNTPQSVRDKVKYAKSMHLGGVGVFQLGADDVKGWCYNQTYPLLNAVSAEVYDC